MNAAPIRINHVSSAPFSGGAARAAFRLHEGLLRSTDTLSTWIDASTSGCDVSSIRIRPPAQSKSLFQAIRRRLSRKDPFLALPPTSTTASNPAGWGRPEDLQNVPIPDVWNLHWVSWFLEWETLLPWMAEQAPIVWTLHDLNPLRGIWHYDPSEAEVKPPWGPFNDAWLERKRLALAKIPADRLTFVGPSKWMVQQVKDCPGTSRFPVHHIPYGIDTDVFHQVDRNLLRAILGVKDDEMVIGCLADTLDDPRKGIAQLIEAVRCLPESLRIHVVTAGHGRPDFGNTRHSHLGPLQTEALLRVFYSGLDIFVCPSLQDNLPNTVIESLCCGTPAVAFSVGGLPDMIAEPRTGCLAESTGSSQSLKNAIIRQIDHCISHQEQRLNCQEQSNREYALALQAKRYITLYSNIVSQTKTRPQT